MDEHLQEYCLSI